VFRGRALDGVRVTNERLDPASHMNRSDRMSSTPHRVLVAGGGVAGLEALLALHEEAGDRVALTLLAPEAEFVYRPMAVAVPFARGHALRHRLAEAAASLGAEFVRGELAEVDDATRTVRTVDGRELTYDSLLVAVGAVSQPALHRVTTWTPELDEAVFGGLLRDIEEGYAKRVAFIVPPGADWSLPAYELALMTAWDARDMGQDDVEVTVYTHEHAPLGLFGDEASDALRADLEAAGVRVVTSTLAQEDPQARARVVLEPGGRPLEAQRIVALPRAAARGVGGLAVDEDGFIVTDDHGKVAGATAVWAAGDAIAFPVKQGGLAAQQADAAARAIAAAAGADVEPRPFRPVLRGVLLTGRGPEWVRRDLAAGADAGSARRHALWWPPTKIAGEYLAPYLAGLEAAEATPAGDRPAGHLVELDVARDVPAAAAALEAARRRGTPAG
jgi:sulfide:quinone oxidoreductase